MKKYSHSRHYGNRLNWRALVISGTLLACVVMGNYGNKEKEYNAKKEFTRACEVQGGAVFTSSFSGNSVCTRAYVEESDFIKPVIVEESPKDETLEQKFVRFFPKSHKTMLAIAKAESGLREDAINWNCYYNDDMTVVYETRVRGSHGAACKKEHRKYAFGVDCFVLQAHYPGRKSCPTDVTLDEHLKEMAELSKKRSFYPWVSWQRGAHLAHMN